LKIVVSESCKSVCLVSSFATHILSGLYSILITVVGLVLSLATAFTHQLGRESYYLEVRVRSDKLLIAET